jgi:arylsulfatase A-like enzyme
MDWTVTILAAAGAKVEPDALLDGMDLMPILTGKIKTVPRIFYWRLSQRKNEKAIRMEEWKYIKEANGEFLFNLVKDSGEKTDLKDKHPDVYKLMKQKYDDWEKSVLNPIKL